MIRVGVVGYGTIGKRVADAVAKQPDMELVGVVEKIYDWRIRMAVKRGYTVYVPQREDIEAFRKGGIEVAGTLEDILREVDVIVDATPKGVPPKNKPYYEKYGVKAIFEGGEKHSIAGTSFVATRNYREALGKQFVRVVSCNTTAISRVVGGIHEKIGVRKARVALVRRAADPVVSHRKGIINTVVPALHVPSHHGPDVKTVIKDLDIVTMAVLGSHNMYHLHMAFLELAREASREEVLKVLEEERRVVLIRGADGLEALNTVFELGRDLGRSRGDLYEIPVWEDSVTIEGRDLYLMWMTPNESNVIPDNIDAIRAVTEAERDPDVSIARTDEALGVLSKLY